MVSFNTAIFIGLLKKLLVLNKPVVFDMFFPKYVSYVIDRRLRKSVFFKFYLHLKDLLSCILVDYLILDTQQHINYVSYAYKIHKSKFFNLPICSSKHFEEYVCNNKIKIRSKLGISKDDIVISFHGSFIPLQGVENILLSLYYLPESVRDKIKLLLLGGGQTYSLISKLIENSEFLKSRVVISGGKIPQKEILQYICAADVCMGIFGTNLKTEQVIPNKVYECIAINKLVITKDTPAIREHFSEKELILTTSNPEDIAKAIYYACTMNDRVRREMIDKAYRRYEQICNRKVLSKRFKTLFFNN